MQWSWFSNGFLWSNISCRPYGTSGVHLRAGSLLQLRLRRISFDWYACILSRSISTERWATASRSLGTHLWCTGCGSRTWEAATYRPRLRWWGRRRGAQALVWCIASCRREFRPSQITTSKWSVSWASKIATTCHHKLGLWFRKRSSLPSSVCSRTADLRPSFRFHKLCALFCSFAWPFPLGESWAPLDRALPEAGACDWLSSCIYSLSKTRCTYENRRHFARMTAVSGSVWIRKLAFASKFIWCRRFLPDSCLPGQSAHCLPCSVASARPTLCSHLHAASWSSQFGPIWWLKEAAPQWSARLT